MEPGTNWWNITIQCAAGVFWTIAYVLIIWRGFRDRTYAMPLVALAANISWEALYTFVVPPPHPDPTTWVAQVVVNGTWFGFDLFIVYQAVRYGPREFRGIPRPLFCGAFAATVGLAGATVLAVGAAFDDEYGVHPGLGQNVLMSALFLAMLQARRSTRGQSPGIAVTKLLGTLCAGGGAWLYPATDELGRALLVPYLTAVVLVLDLAYLVALLAVRRRERAGGGPGRDTREKESAVDLGTNQLPVHP